MIKVSTAVLVFTGKREKQRNTNALHITLLKDLVHKTVTIRTNATSRHQWLNHIFLAIFFPKFFGFVMSPWIHDTSGRSMGPEANPSLPRTFTTKFKDDGEADLLLKILFARKAVTNGKMCECVLRTNSTLVCSVSGPHNVLRAGKTRRKLKFQRPSDILSFNVKQISCKR